MKQTTNRIISMLLSVLMLVSMMTVFSSAAINDTPSENYYEKAAIDSIVVNSEWANKKTGDSVEYYFRNKLIKEKFDEQTHFVSFDDAYKYCIEIKLKNPVIILCPGVYSTKMMLTQDVTILGTNAGLNPNVDNGDNSPWGDNLELRRFTTIACQVEIDKYVASDIEVVFDGIKFINGFSYIDTGLAQTGTSVIVRNSVFDNLSAPKYGLDTLSSIFNFQKAVAKNTNITFENIRAKKINVNFIGNYIANLNISNSYYGDSTAPMLGNIDAITGTSPNYIIKDSMFYNNVTEQGVLRVNNSQKDSTTRTSTNFEISGTKFIDGPANDDNINNATAPSITYVLSESKNKFNVHDCEFIANRDHSASPFVINCKGTATTSAIIDAIKVNSCKFVGYPVLNDTTGLLKQTTFDFTANYFATADGKQIDPIYPSPSSYNNIKVSYFWIDEKMEVPSSNYYINNLGTTDYDVDNTFKTIHVTLPQNTKLNFNIKAADNSTEYSVYSDASLTKEVKSINSDNLYTGSDKNVFYVVGISNKAPNYKFIYELYVSTYNPKYATAFNQKNTYMYSPEVAKNKIGSEVCKDWNGATYKFIVGKTIFSNLDDLFKIADAVPTILLPAGVYTENLCFTESAVVLGAKYGINPNIPQYENPEKGWELNPERANPDQETTFENCVIYISTNAVNVSLDIDGITLGEGSAYSDMGENLETYTTSSLKNILINNAGAAEYKEKGPNGEELVRTTSDVFHFGGNSNKFSKNHKDVRLTNIRMENLNSAFLVGTYMESLRIDGLYFAGIKNKISSPELTAPKGQNFTLDIRNSCFYKCTPSTAVVLVSNKQTDSPEREFNKVTFHNNIFYQPSQYEYGVIGIRFNSKRDSLTLTNNTIISTYAAHSPMPGAAAWFTGATDGSNLSGEKLANIDVVSDVTIKYNRFIGPYKVVDMRNVSPKTCWDYSKNYACDLDNSTKVGGNFEGGVFDKSTPGIKMTYYTSSQKGLITCDSYFADYEMTELVNASEEYKTELKYSINGPGKIDSKKFTYTDTVAAGTSTYNFGIKLETKQASYGIYSDPNCLYKVEEPVVIDKKVNEFYIKIASYKDTVVHTYKATITKQLSNEAKIINFDNHTISDKNITAIVPIGTTSLLLKNLNTSEGATVKIYNNSAKTEEFLVTKITGITTKPTVKYIEVTSEDGKVKTTYNFSVKQGVNTLADITAIDGAVKTGSTSFEASIPVDATSFTLIPYYSTNAEVKVKNEGRTETVTSDSPYVIYNIGNKKTVTLEVTSQSGNKKTYTLTIVKDKSSVDLSYIFNMYNPSDDNTEFYTKLNTSEFNVYPAFKNINTKYKLYKNATCTEAYANNTVYLTKKSNVAYLKATSENGKVSKVYKLMIDTANPAAEPVPEVDIDATKIFTDVKAGSWYEKYVAYAVAHGIFEGTSKTTFSPTMNLTRAQFVRILANLEGIDVDDNTTTSFTDVKSGQWYTGAVKWAADNKIVSGIGDNKFAPNDNITREQMCVMLVNYYEVFKKEKLEETSSKILFKDDNNIATWAKTEVYKCQQANLVNGTGDNNFSPKAFATRAEGATIFTSFHSAYLVK